jgi:hypothetical protein
VAVDDRIESPRKDAAPRRAARLPRSVVKAIDESKILGVRAGARSPHRFTGVWPIVIDGRVFARSWTIKPDGWNQMIRAERVGTIQVGDRTVRVRAVPVRSGRLLLAIENAYAAKYPTLASRKYVVGFRTARRRKTTVEFVPR